MTTPLSRQHCSCPECLKAETQGPTEPPVRGAREGRYVEPVTQREMLEFLNEMRYRQAECPWCYSKVHEPYCKLTDMMNRLSEIVIRESNPARPTEGSVSSPREAGYPGA